MPTYEYKCDACGHDFEKFQSMSAAPVKKCPKCGKNKVRRLIGTGAGLIFKGSGFYITDYRDKGYTEKAKAESSAATGATDSKPDTTSTTTPSNETKPAAEPNPAPKPAVTPKPSSAKKQK